MLIGACATVLGNIRISKGVKIGAGSLVLKPVPPYALVAGSPARIVGYYYTYGGGSGLNSVEEVKPPKPEVRREDGAGPMRRAARAMGRQTTSRSHSITPLLTTTLTSSDV